MVRGQKLEKLLSYHEAQNKSGRISATIVVFLLMNGMAMMTKKMMKMSMLGLNFFQWKTLTSNVVYI